MGSADTRTHELKTSPKFFWKIFKGEKTFQIRINDRGYQTGDRARLYEFDGRGYTGYALSADIGFMTDFKQKPNYVVFSLHNIRWFKRPKSNEKSKKRTYPERF